MGRAKFLGLVTFACAAIGLVGSSGCQGCGKTTASTDAAGPLLPTGVTAEEASRVLARVGPDTITLGDYATAIEHLDEFDRLRYRSPARRKELLDEMINVTLLAQEAANRGVDKDPLTQQEIRALLRDAMLAEARRTAPKPADIPESQVQRWYDDHRADYKDPERRRVAAIVVTEEALAKDTLATLEKDPFAWGRLVRERSIDANARADVPFDLAGDLGIVSPPGDPRGASPAIPEAVRAAVFTLKEAHEVAKTPVHVDGKYYVVKLMQTFPPHERTFEEAARSIRLKLAQDGLQEAERELINELRKTTPVDVDQAAIASIKIGAPPPKGAPPPPPSAADAGAPHLDGPHD